MMRQPPGRDHGQHERRAMDAPGRCALCHAHMNDGPNAYPHPVCRCCDAKAVTAEMATQAFEKGDDLRASDRAVLDLEREAEKADASDQREAQIHGSARFSESNPHHPLRIGEVGRVEIPDSSHEGCDGSAGGLALPFHSPCLGKIRSVAKRGRAPAAAAPRPRLEPKRLRERRMFLDRGWTPPRLTRGFGEKLFQLK